MTNDRRALLRDAAGIGLAVGAFGLSYGAIAVASGFTVLQTCALSVLMFTGASQFALVGVSTLSDGRALVLDERAAGPAAAGAAIALRAPFLVVVAVACATTAVLRVV
jgi:AzlC protein